MYLYIYVHNFNELVFIYIGQRRRVQLVMGLLQPWELLLLDEVTVDLDVLVRADFLAYLKEETETRGATIVYATHIFDGKKKKKSIYKPSYLNK